MKPFMSFVAVVGLAIGLSACTTGSNPLSLDYKPESKENLLADSGFRTLPLKTPARSRRSRACRPTGSRRRPSRASRVWIYPDRNICGCLYIGSQTAYDTFIKKAGQQMIDTRVNQMYDNNDPDPTIRRRRWRTSIGAMRGTPRTPMGFTSTRVETQ